MLAYVLWLLVDFLATALDGIVTPPAVLDSIGVWGYRQPFPALLPLLLHLLTTVAVAGLSRNQVAAACGSIDVGLAAAAARGNAPAAAEGADSVADAAAAAAQCEGDVQDNSGNYGGRATPAMDVPGSSPTAAAERELRQLVAFGTRMSYSEGERAAMPGANATGV